MVAKHQFFWMRTEIHLVPDVVHVERADVVLDEGQGNDQGSKSAVIVVDRSQQLSLSIRLQPTFQVVSDVMQHVHMLAGRCFHRQSLHEQCTVFCRQFIG